MTQLKIKYFAFTCITILLGLMSRQISWLPLYIGDTLYAVMIFLIMRMLFTNIRIYQTSVITLVITYLIEISQLYQSEWITTIRSTLLGRLVLGQGFLWSDLLAYLMGVILVTLSATYFIEKANRGKI